MMDFSDALDAMKDGKRVRRALWTNPGYVYQATMEITVLSAEDGARMRQVIVRRTDGTVFAFGGSQDDILADGWEVAG